jgi:uncharacterized protein YggT (Ycf19 family)
MTIHSHTGVDRVEETHTVVEPGVEQTTQVVEDVGAERNFFTARLVNLIWLIGGILEILFGLRFVLKLFAANPRSGFAELIYGATEMFLLPFRGLTMTPAANGMVLEVSTLIAMVAYFLLFWVIAEVVYLLLGTSTVRTVRTVDHKHRLHTH